MLIRFLGFFEDGDRYNFAIFRVNEFVNDLSNDISLVKLVEIFFNLHMFNSGHITTYTCMRLRKLCGS